MGKPGTQDATLLDNVRLENVIQIINSPVSVDLDVYNSKFLGALVGGNEENIKEVAIKGPTGNGITANSIQGLLVFPASCLIPISFSETLQKGIYQAKVPIHLNFCTSATIMINVYLSTEKLLFTRNVDVLDPDGIFNIPPPNYELSLSKSTNSEIGFLFKNRTLYARNLF